MPLGEVRLLAPVEPSKIVCIGRNYREHAKELNHPIPTEPLFFLKPPSSVIGTGDEIRRPNLLSQRVDYEGELGVVIGKRCYRLREDDDVRPYILGYTCVNDVTARDLQEKDGQWTRAKGFDTFCPVGPVVADDLDPWKGVGVQTLVNGQVRQNGTTVDFLFPLDVLIRFISQVMTLEPGDLIATGTPRVWVRCNPATRLKLQSKESARLRILWSTSTEAILHALLNRRFTRTSTAELFRFPCGPPLRLS